MSWHFSQVLVEEFSAASCLDGDVFVQLKETDTPETYCWRDKTTECLSLFQFGMTSRHSTASLGEDLLTWFREVFLVKTSASREQCGDATAWQESDPVYGGRCCELLGRFVLPLFSVKIRQRYELRDWKKLSKTLPESGMRLGGFVWELTLLDCITNASGFGSTLPTPTARDYKDTVGMKTTRSDGKTRLDRLPMLLFAVARSAGLCKKTLSENTVAQTVTLKDLVQVEITGRDYCPELPEWVMGWPIGWTDLRPLAMDRFQQWLLSHGKFYT
jgi:hypothetical protein